MSQLPPPDPSGRWSPPPAPPTLAPPPGYVHYGTSPTPRYRRVGGLARWVVILLTAVIVTELLDVVARLLVLGDARDYLDGRISASEFEDAHLPLDVTPVLMSLVTIALMVLTIVWMHRVATNHQGLGRVDTWGPGWAIAGWFLPPGVLYVLPYLMLRELWRGSDPATATGLAWKQGRTDPLITVWWVLFGLVPLAFIPFDVSAALRALGGVDDERTARALSDWLAVDLLRSATAIGAAATFLVVVRRLTARHQRLVGEVAA